MPKPVKILTWNFLINKSLYVNFSFTSIIANGLIFKKAVWIKYIYKFNENIFIFLKKFWIVTVPHHRTMVSEKKIRFTLGNSFTFRFVLC